MWTAVYQQQRLIIQHQQQQATPFDLERPPITFIQIDQTLKRHEHKADPVTVCDQNSSMRHILAVS